MSPMESCYKKMQVKLNKFISQSDGIWALFSYQKNLQIFLDSPSHQIFKRMYEVLNIDENKN